MMINFFNNHYKL